MKIKLLFLGMLFSISSQAQVLFSEDFDGIGGPTAGGAGTYTLPAGFMLRNVDNFTPAASVAYVNEAWERREDFSFNVADSAVFSTSWYSPAGSSNDWMWTPLIGPLPANTVLSWNAVTYDASYPDGYEVRVMTAAQGPPTGGSGVIGNQITNSTSIFSIAAENTAWTARTINLNAYAGQSVYIGFRNNSNDKFLLLVDDIKLEVPLNYDLSVSSNYTNPYTIAPSNQLTTLTNFKLEAVIANNGAMSCTNVNLGCAVYIDGSLSTTLTGTAIPSLTNGATSTFTIPYTPTIDGSYTFKYYPILTESDQVTANDTLTTIVPVVVEPTQMARDNDTPEGGLGIGAGNGGYLGQLFTIETAVAVESINIRYNAGYTGEQLAGVIYNTSAGVPSTMLASTDTLVYPDNLGGTFTLPISGGSLLLNPGTYLFAAVEFDSTLQVANTSTVFKTNTVYVNWPTIPGGTWAAVETFGASFAKTFCIRPQFDICYGETGGSIASVTPANCGSNNGEIIASLDPGYGITWEDMSTNTTYSNLGAGYYTYTITNGTCTFVDSVLITSSNGPSAALNMLTNAACNGENGTITIDITGGTAPYAVVWSPVAGTGITLTAPAGTYTATITDDIGCITTFTGTITEPTALTTGTSMVDASCATCADGEATATPTGGSSPYTYLWSNGGTTATIQNLLPGTYTVTVTDDNGCTSNQSVVVGFLSITEADLAQFGLEVYPNPMTDFVQVTSKKNKIQGIKMIDANGKVVLQKSINDMKATIETASLAKGSYQLVINCNGQAFTLPMVK